MGIPCSLEESTSSLVSVLHSTVGISQFLYQREKMPGVVGGAMKDDIEENLPPPPHVSRNQGQL